MNLEGKTVFILCVNLFIILLFFEINNITLCAEPSFFIFYIFCVEFTFFCVLNTITLVVVLQWSMLWSCDHFFRLECEQIGRDYFKAFNERWVVCVWFAQARRVGVGCRRDVVCFDCGRFNKEVSRLFWVLFVGSLLSFGYFAQLSYLKKNKRKSNNLINHYFTSYREGSKKKICGTNPLVVVVKKG